MREVPRVPPPIALSQPHLSASAPPEPRHAARPPNRDAGAASSGAIAAVCTTSQAASVGRWTTKRWITCRLEFRGWKRGAALRGPLHRAVPALHERAEHAPQRATKYEQTVHGGARRRGGRLGSSRMPPTQVPSKEMLQEWYGRVRQAKPFLRWAGGKQYFLVQFAERIPSFPGTYIEPFLGSGSVFFKVMAKQSRPAEARLGDINKQLIQCFVAVRDDPERCTPVSNYSSRATWQPRTSRSTSTSSETSLTQCFRSRSPRTSRSTRRCLAACA